MVSSVTCIDELKRANSAAVIETVVGFNAIQAQFAKDRSRQAGSAKLIPFPAKTNSAD